MSEDEPGPFIVLMSVLAMIKIVLITAFIVAMFAALIV